MAAVAGGASRARAVAVRLLLICLGLASAASAQTLDDRVYAVARQLMCPVCQGQTVAESDSALARDMKAIIRQKLEAGETPNQILRYFVGQFGESVLAEPRPRGAAVILYLAPPLAEADRAPRSEPRRASGPAGAVRQGDGIRFVAAVDGRPRVC